MTEAKWIAEINNRNRQEDKSDMNRHKHREVVLTEVCTMSVNNKMRYKLGFQLSYPLLSLITNMARLGV